MPSPLPKSLSLKLHAIPHTSFPLEILPYLPASAKLEDGSIVDCLFWGFTAYGLKFGPWSDKSRTAIELERVMDVTPSKHQLPPRFANKIYPSVMDDAKFNLTMKDGKRFYYHTEPVIDFIEYPLGYGQEDIESADVGWGPHEGGYSLSEGLTEEGRKEYDDRRKSALRAHSHSWCLFAESAGLSKAVEDQIKEIGGW